MKKLLLTISILICGMTLYAQNSVDIEIKIINDNDEPMQSVSARSENDYLLGVSDWRGELTLHSMNVGDVIYFSHVAYHEMGVGRLRRP